ncbi:MAG: hypothetical protein GY845_04285, partial [Planctomycetes bacterium]|nr:hypothetical protein [Planctomycetota bacterium]
YSRNTAVTACEAEGDYHLVLLEDFQRILDPCSESGNDHYCDACDETTACNTLFPGYTDYYMSNTPRPGSSTYYYRANFSNGRVEDKSYSSTSYKAMCIKN